MRLANCNEHPEANDRSLSCWAIRHDDGRRVTPDELMEEINRLRMLCKWTPVTDILPESGKPVLVACGKKVLRAAYAAKHALDEENWGWGNDEDGVDYDDTTGKTYWPEGWYEWNEYEECHWWLDTAPTHWMPLPEVPNEN